MLNELSIANTASYPLEGQKLTACKQINFIYGANGSGKTTISRVIADPGAHPNCVLTWQNGREVERLVYNADFAERSFSSSIKGIFTLGEESTDTKAKIDAARVKKEQLEADIRRRQEVLTGADGKSGKRGELQALWDALETKSWAVKQKHDAYFVEPFTGFRKSKNDFCTKVVAEFSSNTADLCALEDLKSRAVTVFQKGLEKITVFPLPRLTDLADLGSTPILKKRIIGKEDVDIAGLILRLNNSDWVKQGRSYLHQVPNACPFCQQEVDASLAHQLDEYFDEAYSNDIAQIDRLIQSYASISKAFLDALNAIIASQSQFVKAAELKASIETLSQRVDLNLRSLQQKRAEPSAVVELEDISPIASEITDSISKTNREILKHNQLVDNLVTERIKLNREVWRLVVSELQADLDLYAKGRTNLDKAIEGLQAGIASKGQELQETNNEIVGLERKITSVQPTVNAINSILQSFGFSNFTLATAGEKGHLYKIVRPDGKDAAKTLSEGEKSFLIFLYFYHLIKGSTSESGMSNDRVVVIDDPVSSLDSDVLFIVSTLIKDLLKETLDAGGQVKQVFVLTHNVYFHKEVTFDPNRQKESQKHEAFWIVRKKDDKSVITFYKYNPIKTSYELLWSEVGNPARSKITIQNTLRRILENYFKILGNQDKDKIVEKFSGRDKQICASLFSWINDGSHSIYDDFNVIAEDAAIERYLDVFHRVFVNTGHEAHYKMMLGICGVPAPVVVVPVSGPELVAA